MNEQSKQLQNAGPDFEAEDDFQGDHDGYYYLDRLNREELMERLRVAKIGQEDAAKEAWACFKRMARMESSFQQPLGLLSGREDNSGNFQMAQMPIVWKSSEGQKGRKANSGMPEVRCQAQVLEEMECFSLDAR